MSQNVTTHSINSEIKGTLSISVPLIASQMIYACSGFMSTAMVAHLGQSALAASGLVNTIWWALSVFFFGILNSVSVLVAHQFGAKNNKAISNIMGQSCILGIVLCAILLVIMLCMPLVMQWTSQPESVLSLTHEYMYSLIWTIPGLVILVIGEQFLAGVNRAKIVLRISIMVVPVEILIIYVLIFGKFGLPKCGIAGVGYGFAITYTLTSIWMIYYLSTSKRYRQYTIFSSMRQINFSYLKELVSVGLPMGLMHVIEVSTFAIATIWVGSFGTTMLAAHQIVLQYLGFAITLVFAMSQAVSVRVGHAVGRQDLIGVQYASYVGMFLDFICVLIIAIAFYFIPQFFISLDVNMHDPANAELIHNASLLLYISGILMIFDNFRIVGFGALRGLKDTKFPMYASFIGFWVIGLSAAYVLGFVLNFQTPGIWWGLTLGIASAALIVYLRLLRLLAKVDLATLT